MRHSLCLSAIPLVVCATFFYPCRLPSALMDHDLALIHGGQYAQQFCTERPGCSMADSQCPGTADWCVDIGQNEPCKKIIGGATVTVGRDEYFRPMECAATLYGLPCETPISYVNALCKKNYTCLCDVTNGEMKCTKSIFNSLSCEYFQTARDLCYYQACP